MVDKGVDTLAVWSAVALAFRILALILLIYIARIQFNEFKYKSTLQPLKKLLFYFVITIVISNVPIIFLHIERILGHSASNLVTSFATVTNAGGMLIIATLLYLVYKYRGDSE